MEKQSLMEKVTVWNALWSGDIFGSVSAIKTILALHRFFMPYRTITSYNCHAIKVTVEYGN